MLCLRRVNHPVAVRCVDAQRCLPPPMLLRCSSNRGTGFSGHEKAAEIPSTIPKYTKNPTQFVSHT